MKTPQMIVNNLNGQKNTLSVGDYKNGVVMMKYNELKTLEL